jgi:MFS family permease
MLLWLSTRFNHTWRWLLRLDLPALPRSEEEIAAEMTRNYRWNFAVNLSDVTVFWFGASFISAATILPLYISKLTTNPIPLALVAIIGQGSWYLPQLLTANWVERLARKKPVVANLGFFLERLPVWLLVVSAALAVWSPLWALVVFFFGYTVHGLGAGVIAIAWQDLLARCFPAERRGRFFGLGMFFGGGTAALGAILSTYLLETFAFPTNFVYIFFIGAGGITLSLFFLALTREPVQPSTIPPRSARQYWAGLPGIVRRDHNFRRFLVARLLLSLGSMGTGFVTVAAIYRWQIPDGMAGLFTAAYLIGQTVGNLVFGFLADRHGHKLSLELSALATFLAFGLAWLAPAPEWYFAVFMLLGASFGAVVVSGILVVLEFSMPARRPTYVGLANSGVGVANMVGPLVGAGLALISYNWLFALSALASLAALITMRWWVKEPRWLEVIDIDRPETAIATETQSTS